MLIVTNFKSFPEEWTASSGESGTTRTATTSSEFEAYRNRSDAIFLVNCDPRLTLQLSLANIVRRSRPLISVDLVLRKPRGKTDRLMWAPKRLLLSRVNLFIHYFRDVSAYREVFGIGPERSVFVPFKVNLQERHHLEPCPDGEYVLCFGRSLRDFDTFFEAMEALPYPAAISRPDPEQLLRNGARFTRALKDIPKNVRILEDDGDEASQIRTISGARLVVLPILKTSMVASGISTCLNSMIMEKCVVGSEGPGMTDVFVHGEVITVPAEDPAALARAIRMAWEDNELRRRTAAAGHAYALSAGGEKELYQRIIDALTTWHLKGMQGLAPSQRCTATGLQ